MAYVPYVLVGVLIVSILGALSLFKRRTPNINPDQSFDRAGVDIVDEKLLPGGHHLVHYRVDSSWVFRNLPDVSWSDVDVIAFHVAVGMMGRDRYAGFRETEWDTRNRFNVWALKREGGR